MRACVRNAHDSSADIFRLLYFLDEADMGEVVAELNDPKTFFICGSEKSGESKAREFQPQAEVIEYY